MGIIKCPDCGKEISDIAPTCPNCGRPMHSSSFSSEQPANSSSLNFYKNILRVLSLLCIIFFFCPVFLVSCGNSSLETELSAYTLARGSEIQEEQTTDDNSYSSVLANRIVENSGLDEINKPHYILYVLLVLPALMLLFLFMPDVNTRNIANIILFLSSINLTSWGIFTYEVKKTAEGAMLLFKITPLYAINILVIICSIIISIILANESNNKYRHYNNSSHIYIGESKK